MKTKGRQKGTATTSTITSDRKIRRSFCIAKYIRTVQQANERTAVEYEYRLSKFEKSIVRDKTSKNAQSAEYCDPSMKGKY